MDFRVIVVPLMVLITAFSLTQGKKLFCYYSSDAQYRQGMGKFMPEDIDPMLCTHVIYAFFQPTADGLNVRSVQWNDLGPKGMYARTVALKQKNPSLKVLLAIGGWVIGSEPFLPIIRSQNTMSTFAKNVIRYLRKYQMDGMDMDWEFPGVRGSTPDDKPKFTQLLKTIQAEFTQEARRTGREKLILTLATAAGSYYIQEGYEPREIVKYPDYLLLMTYNYHGLWENVTGHHSSVWKNNKDEGPRAELHMKWTVDYWLAQGASKDRLILGLATYGMTFRLVNRQSTGVLAPAYGGGRGARYTNEAGIMAYYEVCENLNKYNWKTVLIEEQKCPYAYGQYLDEFQWVGYDDVNSMRIKVQTLINGYDLAGAFVWSVEMDDFHGMCNQGRYPLLNIIVTTMRGGLSLPLTTARPNPPTVRPTYVPPIAPNARTFTPLPNFGTTTVAAPVKPSSTSCAALGRGIFPDPNFCGQFFYCVQTVEGKFVQFGMRCPARTSFHPEYLTCVWDSKCRNNAPFR